MMVLKFFKPCFFKNYFPTAAKFRFFLQTRYFPVKFLRVSNMLKVKSVNYSRITQKELPLRKINTISRMSENENPLQEAFNEKGERMSPVLPQNVRNFLIDIDGTICDDVPNEEPERMATVLPYPDAVSMLNKWYDEGHIIYFFTSRTEAHREVTEAWLLKHGF